MIRQLLAWILTLIVVLNGPAAEQSNIVVIMADDLGYGDVRSFWQDSPAPTPHLDAMATDGMRLTDFHSSGNVCSPTRAGLLTGRYQQRAGIPGVINADPKVVAHYRGLQHSETTFAELLQSAGYRTAIYGKWHLGYDKKFNPITHGFDRFRGFVSGNIDYFSHYDRMEVYDWWDGQKTIVEEGYSTHLITHHAVQFIHDNKDRPFCLYVAHEAVHAPWQGPNDVAERGPNKVLGKKKTAKQALPEMLTELDKSVGEIRSALKETGIDRKTLVFFFSDNGPAGGSSGPLRGRKGSNWEGGHRVPAIACWPGIVPPGSVSDELSISLDLMPTMLEIANVQPPKERPLDGMSLLSLLRGNPTGASRKLFWNGKAMSVKLMTYW